MADILNKDPAVYQRERDAFIRDLRHFHESRGTPARKLPFINGKEFDLYLLYHLVTARGGWVKVNQRNEWGSVLDQFETLKHCVNGEVALKQIYLRYLDRYEKIHFLGETLDRGVDDDEDSRHKRFSTRTLHPVPQLYNYHQHIVPDNVRTNGKFSTNLYQASEYDKLALSLISPLPNEQDFAINVCALLSGTNNEGKSTTLKLCNHPRLLHYLLAHAAVYNHNSLRNLMEENYKEVRGYSLKYFWSDVLEDKELSILMDEKKHVKRRQKKNSSAIASLSSAEDANLNTSQSGADSEENQKDTDEECRLKLQDDDGELFCVGRSYGTQDFVGQRVLQVAMILRNATFIEENVPILAQDTTFLRFVLLCCGSKWNCLHQLGFDMLSNIANEITLEDSLMDQLLNVVCRGLESHDRAVILACVETLNKLGQKEENEDIMLRCIEQKVYNRICSFLSLQDIMLLIHTLECLYSLSSLGEKACNSIMHVRGAVDSLVSLITVEAQSYGPKACILMRVVETVTGDIQDSESSSTSTTATLPAPVATPSSSLTYHSTSASASVNHSSTVISTSSTAVSINTSGSFVLTSSSVSSSPLVSSVPSMASNSAAPPNVTVSSLLQATPLPTPAVASPVAMPVAQHTRPATPQRVIMPSTAAVTLAQQTSTSSVSVVVSSNTLANQTVSGVATTTTMAAATTAAASSHPSIVATQQENENFASQWLRNTFETHNQPGRGIEQGEMYKLYLKACSLAGRKSYIAPLHFPQCVRNVFGASAGPRQVIPATAAGIADTSSSKLFVYEGIQVRAKPLNVTVNPSNALTQSVSSTHPHLSNVLLNAGTSSATSLPSLKPANMGASAVAVSPSTSAGDSSNSTSLIKSLLANKVGDFMSPKAASVNIKNEKPLHATPHQLVLNTAVAAQVTQRQQQQQQQQQLQQQHKIVQQTTQHVQQVTVQQQQQLQHQQLQQTTTIATADASGVHLLPSGVVVEQQQQQQTKQIQAQIPQQQTVTQQLVQVASSTGGAPQLVQVSMPVQAPQLIQAAPPPLTEPKSQMIQLTPALQQQLLQMGSADQFKPSLLQITNPAGGQPQYIQITHSTQQQLLQVCQQASQTGQTPILQLCQVKQEPSAQTPESAMAAAQAAQAAALATPQMILSQPGQPQQVIQVSQAIQQQLLSQIPPQLLQQASQVAAAGGRSILTQQLVPEGSQPTVPAAIMQAKDLLSQQPLPTITDANGQPIAMTPQQIRQLLQDQQQAAVAAAQLKQQQQQVQQTQSVGTQVVHSGIQTTPQIIQQTAPPQPTQIAQASTVSVITSTASAAANMKPYMSRINGMRNFQQPVSIVIDDDIKTEPTTSLLADEKLESSPELSSSSNSNDSADVPKPVVPAPLTNSTTATSSVTTGSKVIVENHSVSSNVTTTSTTTTMVNNKTTKFNDLDAELSESSSNQSLPVISIKDAENNLPACELTNDDSSGMFEDFLLNGKSNTPIDDSITNNLMSEDSLLNNLIMGEELANSMISPENSTSEVPSTLNEFPLNNTIKMECSDTNDSVDNSAKTDNNVSGTTPMTGIVKQENNFAQVKKDNAMQVDNIVDSIQQNKMIENNFANLLKTEKKPEDNKPTKSLMLAELLEKNTERKEAPIVNGALRIGEKGLELISKDELQRGFKTAFNEKSVICSNKKNFTTKNSIEPTTTPMKVDAGIETKPEFLAPLASNQQRIVAGVKRTNDQEVQCDSNSKKPHLNGDTNIKTNDEDALDESNVKASSSAANLYAALAADVLGDIDGMDEDEVLPPPPPPPPPQQLPNPVTSFQNVATASAPVVESHQQLYLTTGPNSRQILLATTPSGALTSRTVSIMGSGGQQYIVTPQTALVQGQPQTVLVTQTAQQQGTGAKTIIILQNQPSLGPQSVQAANQTTQKMIMQKMPNSSAQPIVTATSSPVIVQTSMPNTIKSVQTSMLATSVASATGVVSTLQQSQGTQISATQFLPAVSVQSMASASSQTLPALNTMANIQTQQLPTVFSINSSNLTSTVVTSQVNHGAQTTVVPQIIAPATVVSQQTVTQAPMAQNIMKTTTNVVPATNIVQTPVSSAPSTPQSRQVKVIKTVPHLQPVSNQVRPIQTTVPVPVAAMSPAMGPAAPAAVPATPPASCMSAPIVPVAAAPSATTASTATPSTSATVTPSITTPKSENQGQFLCEWRSCMRSFKTANEVYLHACSAHCPSGSQEIQCLWERCDAMKRKRFSLMTHLYDRHCNPEILKMMAVRRKQISINGRSEIPPPPAPPPHPGYAPNAALHAIKRHALEFVNPKELQDDNEGPVTKSIRLTSSLILRNVVIYSTSGRRYLSSFEPHLASIALSNVESSRTIAQILYDMNEHNR
ncbi:AT-rich interactive domain-containing protein 2 isoform X2 [Planococcus citri]|uniref:AT-rich interactive domain-containing protein 2 isoform X2 n=1 Tax=Planococcus citri TaxID=170843 RepID=UPI0031F87DF4